MSNLPFGLVSQLLWQAKACRAVRMSGFFAISKKKEHSNCEYFFFSFCFDILIDVCILFYLSRFNHFLTELNLSKDRLLFGAYNIIQKYAIFSAKPIYLQYLIYFIFNQKSSSRKFISAFIGFISHMCIV